MGILNYLMQKHDLKQVPEGTYINLNPTLDGVLWITHTHEEGRFYLPPYKSVISKDMDMKFGMIK